MAEHNNWPKLHNAMWPGVVGKGGSGHQLIMRKAKTEQWVLAVRAKYDPERAKQIEES